jgi:GrpB-like predicted nucleotidyltransferase (UPF0157 family)
MPGDTPSTASDVQMLRGCAVSEPIVVVDYDPRWPVQFEELRWFLLRSLGEVVLGIEHVGSTAVPGLAARPGLDLDVVIRDEADHPGVTKRTAALGYRLVETGGIPYRAAFEFPAHLPAHYLYFCPIPGGALLGDLQFRDHLRAHPRDAAAYERLKRQTAAAFPNDLSAYTEAKGAFIRRLLLGRGVDPAND